MIISPMEGCSSMSPWANMYQQGGIGTPGSVSLFSDPIQEVVHRHNQGIGTISHNNQPQGRGVISWGEGPPSDDDHQLPMLIGGNNLFQSQPFDATSSIDQSLECLLSGTNSNTEASDNDQDDGISMLFSSDCGKNFWNFSSNNNTQNNVNNNSNSNSNNNNNVVSPNETSNNPKKRSYNNIHNLEEEEEEEDQKFKLTSSTSPPPKSAANKRQRTSTERLEVRLSTSSNISFQQGSSSTSSIEEPDAEAIQQMKEMIYRAAAFRPVNFGADPVERPKRKNVKISSDPQTVAARQRRERISEKLRVLQKIVPGGSKMDTASMLDEAANYLKFLRNQVKDLENLPNLGNYKLDQYHFSTNASSNIAFLPPSINLQFSPMAFSMQGPHYSLPKP